MNNKGRKNKRVQKNSNIFIWILVALAVAWALNVISQGFEKPTMEIPYAKFFEMVRNEPAAQKIKACVKTDNIVRGELADGTRFVVNVPDNDPDLLRSLRENVKDFDIRPPKTLWMNIFYSLGPMVLFILFLWLFAYRSPGGGGGGEGCGHSVNRRQLWHRTSTAG